MILRTLAVTSAVVLAACSTAPTQTDGASQAVPAELLPPLPRPLEIVEIPKPIPFPNQLKPLPELSMPAREVPRRRV